MSLQSPTAPQRGLLGRVTLEDALATLVSLTVANRWTDRAETLRSKLEHPRAVVFPTAGALCQALFGWLRQSLPDAPGRR